MGLTSGGTIVGSVLLLVLITACTMTMWNRLTGPAKWAVRAVLLLIGQASAVLIAALVVNSTFGFYLSWSELLGRHPSLVAAAPQSGRLDGSLRQALNVAYRTGRGLVVPLQIPGTVSRVPSRPALVYLPAQYGDPTYAAARFPVIELLDGFPGSPQTWTGSLHVASVLDREISTKQMYPSVVVMPTQNVDLPRDTECANVAGGPQVDTYLSRDVRTAVEHALRVSPDGKDWAVAGYSTGGYCAAILMARHPSLFGAAASIEGYNRAAQDRTTGHLFGRDARLADQANLLWWVRNRPVPAGPLLELATRQDRQSYIDDRILAHAVARSSWSVWLLMLPRGGHNMATFAAEVPYAFDWLTRHLGAPLNGAPTIDGMAAHQLPTNSPGTQVERPVPPNYPAPQSGSPVRTSKVASD